VIVQARDQQESQYSFDHCRVFDTGNDPDIITALIASFDINIKLATQIQDI